MTYDQLIQVQCNILMKTFPELINQTLEALNADGILWRSLETGKYYLIKHGKAECLAK